MNTFVSLRKWNIKSENEYFEAPNNDFNISRNKLRDFWNTHKKCNKNLMNTMEQSHWEAKCH